MPPNSAHSHWWKGNVTVASLPTGLFNFTWLSLSFLFYSFYKCAVDKVHEIFTSPHSMNKRKGTQTGRLYCWHLPPTAKMELEMLGRRWINQSTRVWLQSLKSWRNVPFINDSGCGMRCRSVSKPTLTGLKYLMHW